MTNKTKKKPGKPPGAKRIGICPTCNNTFECYPSNKKVYCSKKCSNANPIVKDKIRAGLRESWNGIHPMLREDVKNKHKETMLKNYGVEYTMRSPKLRSQARETINSKSNEEKEQIQKKRKNTNLIKYGHTHANYFTLKKRQDVKYETIISSWKHIKPLFERDEYHGCASTERYKFQCVECSHSFEVSIDNGYIPHCRICASKNNQSSKSIGEYQIIEYIKSLNLNLNIEHSNRNILNGKEIDIYIPELKLGIEFNGIYWHSESNGKHKRFHINKTNSCAHYGIQLLHIYDYQWNLKQDIIKSLIASKLGYTSKIYARKCIIKKISSKIKNSFLNETHIQGQCNSSINLGLFYNEELVSIMTFGKSRYDKKYEYELLRYSSKLHTTVIGGFSKLLNYFIKEYTPKNIMTYCDRNTSIGNVYLKNKFSLVNVVEPGYFYFKDSNVYSREQFQKHKLASQLKYYDANLTEYQNLKMNGYDRVWNCGNLKFEMIIR